MRDSKIAHFKFNNGRCQTVSFADATELRSLIQSGPPETIEKIMVSGVIDRPFYFCRIGRESRIPGQGTQP